MMLGSNASLAWFLLQIEGTFQAASYRARCGNLPEYRLRQLATELRETATELEQCTTAQPDTGPTERVLAWHEVTDALRKIHVLSSRGAVMLLENPGTAAELHELLMWTAFRLTEVAKLAVNNADALTQQGAVVAESD